MASGWKLPFGPRFGFLSGDRTNVCAGHRQEHMFRLAAYKSVERNNRRVPKPVNGSAAHSRSFQQVCSSPPRDPKTTENVPNSRRSSKSRDNPGQAPYRIQQLSIACPGGYLTIGISWAKVLVPAPRVEGGTPGTGWGQDPAGKLPTHTLSCCVGSVNRNWSGCDELQFSALPSRLPQSQPQLPSRTAMPF